MTEQSALTRVIVKLAPVLAVIGGSVSTVTGCWYLSWILPPDPFSIPGLTGLVFGIAQVLGGVLLHRGRVVLGANLAIWCSLLNLGGAFSMMTTMVYAMPLLHPGTTAFVFAIVIVMVLPLLGGVLALSIRKSRNANASGPSGALLGFDLGRECIEKTKLIFSKQAVVYSPNEHLVQ